MNNDAPLTKGDLQTLLDHITRERRNTENYIDKQLTGIKSDVAVLKEDVAQLKDDVAMIASILGLKRNQIGKLTKTA